jgi:DNA-binding IclR family transcriptional regulator
MTNVVSLTDRQRSSRVEARGDGRYRGGPRVLAVAGRIAETVGHARLIEPILRELQAHTDETIHFGILSGLEAVYVAKLAGPRPYQMASQVGTPLHLHSTAIGKAILSYLPDDRRHALTELIELSRRTERTITSRRGIEEEAQTTRKTRTGSAALGSRSSTTPAR